MRRSTLRRQESMKRSNSLKMAKNQGTADPFANPVPAEDNSAKKESPRVAPSPDPENQDVV